MKLNKVYWGVVGVLAVIHLQFLMQALPFRIPIPATILAVAVLIFFLYKRILLQISILGISYSVILFILQLLLLGIYIGDKPSWVNLIPFTLFLGVETVRITFANKLASLRKELEELEKQHRQMNETFRAVRSERHDFLKHVSAIHFMMENGTYGEAKDYLDQLVDGYKETNLSIRGERGAVAATLHEHYKKAKAAGIRVIYDFDLPVSSLPLSDKEIVALIGNLLSNSLDACQEWQVKHKKQALVTLQFYKRSGLYLLICKNHTLPITRDILDSLYHSYGISTKSGEHKGLGTKIISDIVHSNHGFLDFVHKGEEFTVKIKIPAIRE